MAEDDGVVTRCRKPLLTGQEVANQIECKYVWKSGQRMMQRRAGRLVSASTQSEPQDRMFVVTDKQMDKDVRKGVSVEETIPLFCL